VSTTLKIALARPTPSVTLHWTIPAVPLILENYSDQLTALLRNREESRDRCYAEYQRLKALLGATEGT
jgi:hypothetical protein